jgi:hypothetical protein
MASLIFHYGDQLHAFRWERTDPTSSRMARRFCWNKLHLQNTTAFQILVGHKRLSEQTQKLDSICATSEYQAVTVMAVTDLHIHISFLISSANICSSSWAVL